MSGSVALFLLLLCLSSMHACKARRLGPSVGRNHSNQMNQLSQDIETQNSHCKKENSMEVIPAIIHHEELKDFVGHLKKQQVINGMNSGQEGSTTRPFESYQHNADAELEASAILETRLMVKSENSDHEEAINSGESDNDVAKVDVVAMDYAQPHRKPPIHNEEH